jgi:hypothetical protein
MLGYRYAFSAGGCFVGWNILGEFFQQNCDKPKADVLQHALLFFKNYVNMVRPVEHFKNNLQGTITDRTLLICRHGHGIAWALIVFVKTAQYLNAVMIPIFTPLGSVVKYDDFLKNQDENVDVSWCKYEQNQWLVNPKLSKIIWPKNGTLYP